MKKRTEIILLKTAYVMMLLAMFIIPPFFSDHQSLVSYFLSDPGSYSLPGSLIINIIFLFLIASSLISGWKYYDGFVFQRIILVLFSLFLIFTALSDLALFNDGVNYSQSRIQLNFYFMTNGWLSFIILTFSTCTILNDKRKKNLTIITGITAAILLILISESDHSEGFWERILLIISFGWIIHAFGNDNSK